MSTLPGTPIPSGALVSPGGPQGLPGIAGPNAVSSDVGNIATIGTDNLILVPQSTFWDMRLRSFNAIGNPNFEVDQRTANAALNYPAGASGQFQADNWLVQKNAATAVLSGQNFPAATTGGTVVPGTNFKISRSYISLTVTTAQANLAVGEYLFFNQFVEGPRWRELSSDVHSISLLCYCTIALNFSVALIDNANGYSLVIPCSIPAATMTLLTLPNLPLWTSSGTFSQTPGVVGYLFRICLGCGATYQTATTGSWINGNYLGTSTNTNFLATLGASFQLRFVQHESGPQCSRLMDKPFSQNLDECLRYYQKTYDYPNGPGATGTFTQYNWFQPAIATSTAFPNIRFVKLMAKTPAMGYYSPTTGTPNAVRDLTAAADRGVNSSTPGMGGVQSMNLATVPAANSQMSLHYTADTGW